MTLLLSIFADDIVPILLIAAVGFVLARRWRVDVKMFSTVTFNVLIPCLIFTALLASKVSAAEFGRTALFAIAATLVMVPAGWLVARLLRLDRITTAGFILSVTFGNVANYALPLVLFAFGAAVLPYATLYIVANSILVYTIGIFIASRGQASTGRALLNVFKAPAVYAVALAAVVAAAGITIPAPVMRPIELLSDAAIPVQILVLGMQLERARVERPLPVGAACLLRLVAAPLLALPLALLIGLRGPALQAGMVQAAMSTAVLSGILAVEYDTAPGFVTSVVFASTLISPITLTVLIALLQG